MYYKIVNKLKQSDSLGNAAAWVIGGNLLMNILRLGSNLLLTRLLTPELFGVMAIAGSLHMAANMFSDVGIRSYFIYYKGDLNEDFLNSVWTIQIVRGGIILLISLLLMYPAVEFFNNDTLFFVLPIIGIGSLVLGFRSSMFLVYDRELKQSSLVKIEMLSYFIQLVIIIPWAWISRDIWPLVWGCVINSVLIVLLSMFFLENRKHSLNFNKRIFIELWAFGKWILLSSAMWFFIMQIDKVIIGKLSGMEQLGIYSVAAVLFMSLKQFIDQVLTRSFFQKYNEIIRNSSDNLMSSYMKYKLFMDISVGTGIVILLVFSGDLVSFLYDDRYQDAGWMLSVLCVGALLFLYVKHIEVLMVAHGDTKAAFNLNVIRVVWLGFALPVGQLWGLLGIIWCLALMEIVPLIYCLRKLSKYNLLNVYVEAPSFFLLICSFLLG